jgi:hypothetical protein
MKSIINRFETKPTVFLILSTLTFVIGIPMMFYMMGLEGGASLIALLPMFAMAFAAIAFVIDFGLVNFSKLKLIWINWIEAGTLLLLCFLYLIS